MTYPTLYDDRLARINCSLNHIAQARSIVFETKKVCPEHHYSAMGRMAEAEDAIVTLFPEIMEVIRKARLEYQEDQSRMPNWKSLIHLLIEAQTELSDAEIEDS